MNIYYNKPIAIIFVTIKLVMHVCFDMETIHIISFIISNPYIVHIQIDENSIYVWAEKTFSPQTKALQNGTVKKKRISLFFPLGYYLFPCIHA